MHSHPIAGRDRATDLQQFSSGATLNQLKLTEDDRVDGDEVLQLRQGGT
jgi:hypothetical protein